MAWSMRAGAKEVAFGDTLSGLGLVEHPEVSLSAESEMFNNPRGDGRRPGQDFMTGQAVSLLVEALPDHRPLDDVWRELFSVWRGDEVRARGGLLATLTADSGRSAFGRPRPISPSMKNRVVNVNRAELVFEAVDDLWYGPEQVTTIRFVPSVGAGLRFPAKAPFRFGGAPTVRNGSVIVPGDVATWPVFEIRGPVVDPTIDVVGGGQLSFRVSLAYDERLVVDTRPWARWVKRGRTTGPDLSAAPGVLSSSGSRLSDVALLPGAYQVLLRGNDPTGTAELRASVWPAFTSF